jgi:hypothetical protein
MLGSHSIALGTGSGVAGISAEPAQDPASRVGIGQAQRPIESANEPVEPDVASYDLPDVAEEEPDGERWPVEHVEVRPIERLAIEGGEGSVDLA